jgi:Ca2+-transporting ATPase
MVATSTREPRSTGSIVPSGPVPVHSEPLEALLARVGAHAARGLTGDEAKQRLARDGTNELPEEERTSALKQLIAQFANPIVLTLLVAAVIAVVHGATAGSDEPFLLRYGDAMAIFLIVILNAVLGYYQERKAEAALDALKKMQTPTARVRRDDRVMQVAASDLVVGDVLELEAGDAVPADARLLQTINFATEEASLTGESTLSGKDAIAPVEPDAPLGDRSTMVFVGTSVVRGKGRAVVVATGTHTELGKLSVLMSSAEQEKTPLEVKLDAFGKRILWVCLGLSLLLFARGMIKGDRSWSELLLEAVSLAVAAIPEGLPAITTITLALGMQRMAARGAILRKLAAVESLGAATIICTDKTGTLTQNEMTVREVYAGGVLHDVSGQGYEPVGEITPRGGQPVATAEGPLRDLLSTIALCNNATLEVAEGGAYRVVGDPTEGALLTLAAKGGLPRESFAPSHTVVHELPFDSDRKRMTVVTLDENGREVAHSKGSADVLLPLCGTYATVGGEAPLDDATRAQILAEAERMSAASLRVLAVARRDLTDKPTAVPHDEGEGKELIELERKLTFLGLVGMIDPPRKGAKEAVAACAAANVRAVMITGDHKLTAVAIARELGLWEEGAMAVTGSELERLDDQALAERVEHVRVFARVTAEQKLRLVRAFKAKGHVVAMTGDGVNDAPALREAHIGVAMGKSGTDVARSAADMVIADDNFATIVDAVREGRAVYRNIQKFIFFLLSSNAGLLVAVFVASFIEGLAPLTPLMILWINLVTNGFPALALGVDPPDPSQMQEPPRKPSEGLLGLREIVGIALVGLFMGGAAIVCYVAPVAGEAEALPVLEGRALAFSLLALSPLFHAFNCRSTTQSVVTLRPLVPLWLLVSVVVSALIHCAVFVPGLQPIFRTHTPSLDQVTFLLLTAAAIIPVAEVVKFFVRRTTDGVRMRKAPVSR